MKLLKLRPVIWTFDFKDTIEFYTNNLGFKCGEYRIDWGWTALYRDDIEIMVTLPNEHMLFHKPIFTGSFYITTENVDEIWNELKDKTKICYPIEDFEYGMREFAVYDNNGYLIQFCQEIL
jgi:uncharacterized glyoxalase superfamily protein PhnB